MLAMHDYLGNSICQPSIVVQKWKYTESTEKLQKKCGVPLVFFVNFGPGKLLENSVSGSPSFFSEMKKHPYVNYLQPPWCLLEEKKSNL